MFLSNRGSFRPETSGAYTLRRRGRRRPKSGSAIGACAVARLAGSGGPIGDYYGSANIPSLTRSRSLTPRRAKQRERRILSALAGGTGKVVECVGSGYLPPHRASLVGKSAEVRYAAGIDKGMIPVLG